MDYSSEKARIKRVIELTKSGLLERFSGCGVSIELTELSWVEQLDLDEIGKPTEKINNFKVILKNDPVLKGKVSFSPGVSFSHYNLKSINFGQHKSTNEFPDLGHVHLRLHLEVFYGYVSFRGLNDAIMLTLAEVSGE